MRIITDFAASVNAKRYLGSGASWLHLFMRIILNKAVDKGTSPCYNNSRSGISGPRPSAARQQNIVRRLSVLTLTPAAATKLQSILDERNLDGYGLRVFVSGSSCCGPQYGMGFDRDKRDGDMVETLHGVSVYVDAASAGYLDSVTIDYEDSPAGGGFRIENPNPAGCSCDESASGCCH
jgi:iron-sulfur cluster assembly protein